MKSKNVAVLTRTNKYDFGSVFQIFSFKKTIENFDCNVDIIDFDFSNCNLSYFDDGFVKRLFKKPFKILFKSLRMNDNKKCTLTDNLFFDCFRLKHIKHIDTFLDSSDLDSLNQQYDTFISAGDEAWNPKFFNDYLFLNFVSDCNKKISYGISLLDPNIKDKYLKNLYIKYLQRFDYLSFREKTTSKYFNDNFNMTSNNVCDPVFLLRKEEWLSFFDVNKNNEKYILVYMDNYTKNKLKLIYDFAIKRRLHVKIISTRESFKNFNFEVMSEISPKNFLESIYNATYVFTDLYYCVCFSLIFNKCFYIFDDFKGRIQINNKQAIFALLEKIDLFSPLINKKIDFIDFDYDKINTKILNYRNDSLLYLKTSLDNVEKNKKFTITNYCTGCGVCQLVCPKNAINIKKNDSGFWEATIDGSKCIRCGACQKICCNNSQFSRNVKDSDLFSYKSNDKTLKKSSSGGLAFDLSCLLSKKGYYVYGCAFEENKVFHKIANPYNLDGLSSFQGSKYLQSNFANNIFKLIEIKGKKIVFGTPCQINGLNNFLLLKNLRSDYVLVDLICHGVPSYNLYLSFIDYIKRLYGFRNPIIKFRDKRKKWQSLTMSITEGKKVIFRPEKSNMFYYFFNNMSCYNKCCYFCHFRNKSAADIRIGDYWGDKYKKDSTGVSCAFALTEKGIQLLNELKCKKENIKDFDSVQQYKNVFSPVYYDCVIKELNEGDHLENIYRRHVKKANKIKKSNKFINNLRKLVNL